jgi:hypothetical protein
MNKEYLPSKQFVVSVAIIVICISVIFGISKLATFLKNRIGGDEPTKLQVKDLVQKDTNNNGIPDWEESLWGLDPNKDGDANKSFILAKRQSLAQDSSVPEFIDENTQSKENEALSKEFFAVIMSLEQTGNLDDTALNAVSDAIGKKIVANPIADIYTKDMATVQEQGDIETLEYFNAYLKLNNKYMDKNIGDELFFIATALNNNDQAALKLVGNIASSYRAYAKELIKIPVPVNILPAHVSLANNYEKVAQSVYDLTKLLSDPMSGMKGIVNYNKYSDALVTDIGNISDNFN